MVLALRLGHRARPQRGAGHRREVIGSAHNKMLAAFRALQYTRAAQSTETLDAAQVRDLAIGYHGALNAIASGAGTWALGSGPAPGGAFGAGSDTGAGSSSTCCLRSSTWPRCVVLET